LGSSTASSASKSPSREAAKNAETAPRCRVRSPSGSGGPLDSPARPACELLRGGFGAIEQRRDIRERHFEHVVKHERKPLRRGQRVKNDEQREPNRIGEQSFLLRVEVLAECDDGVGDVEVDPVLASGAARAQRVQTHPANNRRQPGLHVLDARGIFIANAKPRLLKRILGLAYRAEHPVSDRA
jgi:hypothetical protein